MESLVVDEPVAGPALGEELPDSSIGKVDRHIAQPVLERAAINHKGRCHYYEDDRRGRRAKGNRTRE